MGNILSITGSVGGSCLSYIGPGLVYLGIHGGRFIELVEQSWLGSMLPDYLQCGSAGDNMDGVTAVETTPLVSGRLETDDNAQPALKDDTASDSLIGRVVKPVVWYFCGFPIWIYIAQTGKRNLTKHIHDLALKSPHPIRIGDVEYTGTELKDLTRVAKNAGNVAILKAIHRSDSLPLITSESVAELTAQGRQSVVIAHSSGGDINKRIGQELLQKKSRDRASGEVDPQQAPPTWYDFAVAVFFILFGVLAFTAGIISLFIQNAR
jgi:hypothetical protein